MFPAFGSVQKTLLKAKVALEARGHVLVPFELPNNDQIGWYKLFGDFLSGDHGQGMASLLRGEQVSRALRHLNPVPANCPYWIKRLTSSLLYWIPLNPVQRLVASLREGVDSDTTTKLWKCVEKRDAVVEEVLSSMDNLHLDLIICPPFPFPALGVEDHHQPELFSRGISVISSHNWDEVLQSTVNSTFSIFQRPLSTLAFGI